MKPSIYLAGPIAGQTVDGAVDWREIVADALYGSVRCFSPMRGKEHALRDHAGDKPLPATGYPEGDDLLTDRGIVARDLLDIRRVDLVFCNLDISADRVSVGTMVEIGYAHALGKPILFIMGKATPWGLYSHPFISEVGSFFTNNLDTAVAMVNRILLPD